MKRHGFVFDKIIDMENLRKASKLACSTRKNKQEVARFLEDAENNLVRLRESV